MTKQDVAAEKLRKKQDRKARMKKFKAIKAARKAARAAAAKQPRLIGKRRISPPQKPLLLHRRKVQPRNHQRKTMPPNNKRRKNCPPDTRTVRVNWISKSSESLTRSSATLRN